jgi:DNA-binding transcriptional MerR regulator
MEYTVSQLASAVQLDLRTVQLWADFGILLPEKGTQGAGTGVHRRFGLLEARIAALLTSFASIGVPRGMLKRLADQFREKLTEESHRLRTAVERAASSKGNNFLYYCIGDTVVVFYAITDEHGPAVIDPMADGISASLMQFRQTHCGILNLNTAMNGLA